MNIHTQLNVSVIATPYKEKAVAITFVVENEDTLCPVSPTAYLTREQAKFLARVIDENADAVPREMVEGDL